MLQDMLLKIFNLFEFDHGNWLCLHCDIELETLHI